MREQSRDRAPDADAIEQRFKLPMVRLSRGAVLGGLCLAKWTLRVDWSATGLEHVRGLVPPFILASNHTSHIDTHAILDSLPRRIRERTAVAAAFDYFGDSENDLRGKVLQFVVASAWHAFGFERGKAPLRSLRAASQLLSRGWCLLLYPEGTRSRSGEMAAFRPGLAVVARLARRPVVPVHVSGGRGVLPQGVWIPRSGCVHVRFGSPMMMEPDESAPEFTERVEVAVRQLAAES